MCPESVFSRALYHRIPADTRKDVDCAAFFSVDYAAEEAAKQKEDAALEKERKMQEALISIRDRFGKNAVVKGLNMQEGATAIERSGTIGGHKK